MLSRSVLALCLLFGVSHLTSAQDGAASDVEEVRSQDLRAGDNEDMRYFLIGEPRNKNVKSKLLLVLPGGDGSADFNGFVRRIKQNALSEDYLIAQLVAPKWDEGQSDKVVWPTKKNPYEGMKFDTETFIAEVIADVEERHKLDLGSIFSMSWSSSGPAAYAYSLTKGSRVTGSFVAMSVFKPDKLPSLKAAKGKAYYLLHSPEDFIPMSFPEAAEKQLGKQGAKVELATYAGGHGWKGDVYGNMRSAIEWLEKNHGKAAKKPKRSR